MFTANQLIQTAKERLHDAEALLAAGRFDGSIYMCGYTIEIALKAKISATTWWTQFPATPKEFNRYNDVKTHDLQKLLTLWGEETAIKPAYLVEWSTVSIRNPESRYSLPTATESKARETIDST